MLQGKSVFFRDLVSDRLSRPSWSDTHTHTHIDGLNRWYLSACVYVYGYMYNSIIIEEFLNLRGTERNLGKVGRQKGKDGNDVNIASRV